MSVARAAGRIAGTLAGTLAVSVVFVLALVAGVLLHLGTAPARRVVASVLPAALDGAFPGKLQLRELGGLSVYGLGGVDVDLVHPDGAVVARLRGVKVTLDSVRAVKAFLGSGPIEIPIRSVDVEGLDIDVSMHEGNLRIADVFVDPNEPATPEDPNARAIDVNIRSIAVRHAWAHGTIEADGPFVDADLDDLVASFALDTRSLRAGLDHVDVVTRSAPRGADFRGRLSAWFDMPNEPKEGEPAQSALVSAQGTVAQSTLSTVAALRGDHVYAQVWLPEVSPTQLASIAPEAPAIAEPASVTVVVDGTFDHLVGRAIVAAGASRVDATVDASFAPSLVATARVQAEGLDASLVGGPSSDVSLDAEGRVEVPESGEPKGRASLTTQPGVVAGVPVPAVVANATFEGGRAHAVADVREPGLRTAIVVDAKPGPRGTLVDARIDVPRADLAALKRRGFEARGTAEVEVRAHADLGAETVLATAKVSALGLSAEAAPGVSVGSMKLDARAEGALENPVVRARLWTREITAAERDVSWASVSVDGPAMSPLVVAEVSSIDVPRIRARAQVDVRGGPALNDVRIEADRGTTKAKLEVSRVVLGSGIPALRDVRLVGLGEPMTMSITPDGAATRIVADAPGLSLAALAELSGLDLGIRRGEIAIDSDVVVAPRKIDGKVDVHVRDVDVRREGLVLRKLDGSVLAELRGREVDIAIDTETTDLGRLHVKSTRKIVLSGPPTEPDSWRGAVGAVEVEADLRLAAVARLVPADMLPVRDVEGRLLVRGDVGREDRTAAPSLDVAIETRELAIVGKPAPPKPAPEGTLASVQPKEPLQSRMQPPQSRPSETEIVDPRPGRGRRLRESPVAAWTMRDVDVSLTARAAPDPREVALELTVRDPHGKLVVVSASAPVDYGRFVAGEPFDLAKLEDTPLSAKVSIPSRKIDDLPPVLGVPGTEGNVVLDATFDGTLKEPKVTVDGGLGQLSIRDSPLEKPFTVKLLAAYDGAKLDAHVALDQDGKRLLKATADGRVAVRDLLHPPPGELPWKASADVRLGPLPLDVLEAVMPAKIDGIAHGHVKLRDLHDDAALEADVSVAGLVLGRVPHREATVKVVARNGVLDAKVRMAQPDGSLDADAKVGIAWGKLVVPELRANEAFDVGVRAKTFRLRAIEPFLTSVLNRLDGRLDGEVRLSKEALTDAAKGRGVRGQLALSKGSVEVAAGGGPLDDVRATVRIDDKGQVRLEDVFARGATGEVRAVGAATFGNAGFHAARLNVVIPKDKPMPVLLSGEHLADVSANVKVSADMVDQGRELRVGVDIPRLQVELPDSLPDGVQTLDEIERARIGTLRRGRFVLLPTDAPDAAAEASPSTFRTRLAIALRDARIIKGDMLSTYVSGNPTLLLEGGRTVMSGSIKLKGGRVDIKGRRFEIESGTITFTGDPANPNVVLTAKWKAPDDSTIYADFVGPLTTGKVTLRSDPPRSREEILALVVFGRAEGYSSGGQQADKGTQAVGMAGGFATEGLNKVLDDVTDLEIRTRVDTSSSTNPRPELEVQISQEIAARIAYVLGELGPGQSPDKTYATLDWNFRPEWSLETTVGDKASTTVDMIWERRY